MSTELLKLNYSKKDYTQILDELKRQVPQLTSSWTDFLDSDIGYSLIQLFAGMADFNNFYLDRQAAETYLSTCVNRDSAVAISNMLGYTSYSISSATSLARFSLSTPYNLDITIRDGTSLVVGNQKRYYVNGEYYLLSGNTEVITTIIQGTVFNSVYTSPGTKWHKISLPKNICNIKVYVDNIEWVHTDSFIYTNNKNCFVIGENRFGRLVIFSGGETSNYPSPGSSIRIIGTLSDGASGNVNQSNSPIDLTDIVYDANKKSVNSLLGVVMIEPAVNGSDMESLDSIKNNAPAYYTTQHRLTTALDYKAEAYTVPGVKSVSSWGGDEVDRYGEVFVCVYGENPEKVPQNLLLSVKSKLELKRMSPIIVRVIPPIIIIVDIDAACYIYQFYSSSEIKNKAADVIKKYFDSLEIGQMLQYSDLVSNMSTSIDGLDYVDLSVTTYSFGVVNAGLLEISIPNYTNLSSIVIKNVSDGTDLWLYTSSECTFYKNILSVPINLPNGSKVKVIFSSQYDDIYPIRDMLLVPGTIVANTYKTNSPSTRI